MISVIVPVYNVEKYIEKCIFSLKAQSSNDFEVLLVNDGSTDKSIKLIEPLIKYDKRFKLIHKENGGVSSARNCGLNNATGDSIVFIDSDDTINSQYLETLFRYSDYDIVLSGSDSIINGKVAFNKNLIPCKWNLNDLQKEKYKFVDYATAPHGILYKSSIINKNQLRFDESISFGEDRDFNIRYISCIKNAINIDYIGYHYTLDNTNSLSHKIYVYNLKTDLLYWDKLHYLLSNKENHTKDEINKYLSNKLFNYIVDNINDYLIEYGLIRTHSILQATIKKHHLDYLKHYHILIMRPEWMKRLFLFSPSLFSLICGVLQLIKRQF